MNNSLLRKNKMYETVLFVLRKNEVVWKTSLPFKKEVTALEDYLTQITHKNEEQSSSKNKSAEKKQLFETLRDATLLVCGAGLAYANQENNDGLKKQFSYTKSTLKTSNEKNFCSLCVEIAEAAKPINDLLLTYNLPANHLTQLEDIATKYYRLISEPKIVRTTSKKARKDMITFFDECDALLKDRLDNMVMLYKNSHLDFYNEYTNARYIGGWSRKKEEGNQETGGN